MEANEITPNGSGGGDGKGAGTGTWTGVGIFRGRQDETRTEAGVETKAVGEI